jgi:hypothetical protein
MFDLSKLRDTAMREGMKLMSSPRVIKLMGSPQGQKVMTFAFQLPQKVQGIFEAQGKRFAKRFKLATRQDLKDLKKHLADLEATLKKVESKLDANGHKHEPESKKHHSRHE